MKEYRALRERHSILALAKTPELACEVTLQPVRAMPVDAAIIFADILLPVEPMGARLRFAPGPVIDNPVRSAADVDRLRSFEPREGLACVLAAIRLTKRELGELPLIGFAGAPFTLASYLIEGGPSKDFVRTKRFMHEQPRAWARLMTKLARVTGAYLRAQAQAGADALQLFDSWIGALSPAQYRACVKPYSALALSTARQTGVPVIHFGTGTAGFLDDFAGAGGDVVGVDWRIDLDDAWRRIGPRAIQGNLDPALLLAPRKALRAAVSDVLSRAKGRRGFIFNLGHGIMPKTPPDSVRAVVDWVHEHELN